MVAVLVWCCCVARTRVTRAVRCLSARVLRRLPLGSFGAFRSGPSVPSARALRYLPLGLRVVAAYPAWFPNNVARNSPARISDFEITSLGLQRLWGVSKNDQVKLRATFFWRWARSLAGPSRHPLASQLGPPAARSRRDSSGGLSRQPIPHGSPTMSHVIPPREFQTLKSHRWDCNVCGVSRKMTKLNYVRHFSGAGLEAWPGPADTHWRRSWVLPPRVLVGTPVGACRGSLSRMVPQQCRT